MKLLPAVVRFVEILLVSMSVCRYRRVPGRTSVLVLLDLVFLEMQGLFLRAPTEEPAGGVEVGRDTVLPKTLGNPPAIAQQPAVRDGRLVDRIGLLDPGNPGEYGAERQTVQVL